MKFSIIFTFAFFVLSTLLFQNCDVQKDEDGSNANSDACFVEVNKDDVKPGESVTLSAAGFVSWNDFQKIMIESQTLTSANPEGVTINPQTSQFYTAVATLSDGTTKSCSFKVTVEGSDIGNSCTLVADPASISEPGDVSLTLSVVGTEDVASTWINGKNLNSTAGGSTTVFVSASTTFIGTVNDATGSKSTCSVDVKFTGVIDTAECKVEPSGEDYKELQSMRDQYKTENDQAVADDKTAALNGRDEFLDFSTANKLYSFDQGTICQAIDPDATCTLDNDSVNQPAAGFHYGVATVNGQQYEVWGRTPDYQSRIFFATESGDLPEVFIQLPQVDYVDTLEVEICECEFNNAGGIGDSDASFAPPPVDIYFYSMEAYSRPDNYSPTSRPVKYKDVNLKQNKIEVPEGKAKPSCPQSWNWDT